MSDVIDAQPGVASDKRKSLTAAAGAAATPVLHWLPVPKDWRSAIRSIEQEGDDAVAWQAMVNLANTRLDFLQTGRLDRALHTRFGDNPPAKLATKPVRLAVLGSSTTGHLLPPIRIGGLRRGLWVTCYEPDYGQYLQEAADPSSALHSFKPTAVLLAFDAFHLLRGASPSLDETGAAALVADVIHSLSGTWADMRNAHKCAVIQQTAMPLFPTLMGSNEHRLPGSPARLVTRLNEELRTAADKAGVDLLALEDRLQVDGIRQWHDPVLWHRAKQEVTPSAGPFYGDMVGRLLAAQQGRSAKCLVLDLDNTLWGGVIGDDGLEGIVLGQGSAHGEAFVGFQRYALDLTKRGVILAVCSKNDEANAFLPFNEHPEMILRRKDISCFVANWSDKAANIRQIAHELNIGLDSLVFVDDNPFERNLVRDELPMVAVPEIGADPGLYAGSVSDAGYFESVAITDEDRTRTEQYRGNIERTNFQAEAADLPAYLRGLEMQLVWKRFDGVGRARVTQLINKTNQFNLMTRRYSDQDVQAVIDDPNAFGLQLRLTDRFGDNGIIAVIIGRLARDATVVIDTWLMSCRVLGRQVEEATLGLVMDQARALGATRLVGEYTPTAKNGMVREHYGKLGFERVSQTEAGATRWQLDLVTRENPHTFITVVEG